MTNPASLQNIFFTRNQLHSDDTIKLVTHTLHNVDDGELFLEYKQSEHFLLDDSVLKHANISTHSGFGFRAILDECIGYAHASTISPEKLQEAATHLNHVKHHHQGNINLTPMTPPQKTSTLLYQGKNPITTLTTTEKIHILNDIDIYLRKKDKAVKQVSASFSGEWQAIQIITAHGTVLQDVRPLVRINIAVIVEKNGRMEQGTCGIGGRVSYHHFLDEQNWKQYADKALTQALTKLEAVEAPAGDMPVVLANGWPGILLHEAVGHGLEGDFNRKKTSAFANLIGEKIADSSITIVDDGTIAEKRGSLTIDDEGTPSSCTTLIENGILKNYMQDRLNARLMDMKPTGNGRRQSYAHQPMPRMTNTYMLNGHHHPEEIISSVKKGLYAIHFDGGQVDITSGRFVFSASEAYLIENGKITTPVKGATLIGNGPDVLKKVTMVGNDMKLDPGVGTCGKSGQSVPVGVGQPTILVNPLTVGGTAL